MLEHIKEFENHSAYSNVKDYLPLPNVSLCVQQNEVHYSPLRINSITYNVTGMEIPSSWPTEIRSGESLVLSGIEYTYGSSSIVEANIPYYYSEISNTLYVDNVRSDVIITINISNEIRYENANPGDYLYSDWTFGKNSRTGWLARCVDVEGTGENKKTVWCLGEVGEDLKWSTEKVDTGLTNYATSAEAETDMSGKENTTYLVSLGSEKYPAATWASQQFNGLGYLPSVGEFDKYQRNMRYYSLIYRVAYWTSTEINNNYAYILSENMYFTNNTKDKTLYYNVSGPVYTVSICKLSGIVTPIVIS